MPQLHVFVRARVLLPGQRWSFRVHDQAEAATMGELSSFGVLFSPGEGRVSTIGTEAEIVDCHPASHGRLDVEAVGRRRFTVEGHQNAPADVAFLDDEQGDGDLVVLRRELQAAVRRYAAAAIESGEGRRIGATLHIDPRLAVFQGSLLMPLSQAERQELLEIPTTTDRYEWLLRVAAGETGLLRHVLETGRMP